MATRRELLIDAYNVMFAEPRFNVLTRQDPERARDEFVAWVSVRTAAMGFVVVVVFDAMRNPRPITEVGRAHVQKQGGVQIVYARASADTWIRERMQSHAEPQHVTVVTSDREILASAVAAGCASMRVTEFLQLDAARKKKARDLRASEKPSHQSKKQLAEWERLFGTPRDDEDA